MTGFDLDSYVDVAQRIHDVLDPFVIVRGQDECWTWTGARQSAGYGIKSFGLKPALAHRIAYIAVHPNELLGDLTIDHLCRNRLCVNPWHLEAVPLAENIRRAFAHITHCKHGHEFTAENTIRRSNGTRQCRTCKNSWDRQYRASGRRAAA